MFIFVFSFLLNTKSVFYSGSIPPGSSFNKDILICNGMHLDDVSCLLEKLSGITNNEIEIKVA